MPPVFAGSYKTVAITLSTRVIGHFLREPPLAKNRSFGDRFVEGTYLRADHDTPCIHIYSITSGSELLVYDFTSFPDGLLFRDPSCLSCCTPVILKDLAHMRIDNAHDDKLVAEEIALHIHMRGQTRAADAAKVLDDPIILTVPSDDQTKKSVQISVIPTNVSSIHASTRATDDIALHEDLTDHNKIAITRAFLRHSVEFV